MRAICKIWKKIVRAFRAKNRGHDGILGSRSPLQVVGGGGEIIRRSESSYVTEPVKVVVKYSLTLYKFSSAHYGQPSRALSSAANR